MDRSDHRRWRHGWLDSRRVSDYARHIDGDDWRYRQSADIDRRTRRLDFDGRPRAPGANFSRALGVDLNVFCNPHDRPLLEEPFKHTTSIDARWRGWVGSVGARLATPALRFAACLPAGVPRLAPTKYVATAFPDTPRLQSAQRCWLAQRVCHQGKSRQTTRRRSR